MFCVIVLLVYLLLAFVHLCPSAQEISAIAGRNVAMLIENDVYKGRAKQIAQ